MGRFFRSALFPLIVIVLLVFAASLVANAWGGLTWKKQKLPRDEIYYEITNDDDDHGNYIETYHVPNGRGGKVFCVVYSDQMEGGGGAGISCDWEHSSRG